MMKMTEHTIGVDISKSHLDVFDAARDASMRFKNSAIGFRAGQSGEKEGDKGVKF
jgi:transposase